MKLVYDQVVREKEQESLLNADAYSQTKTTWNNSDWLAHEKATFYWSRFVVKIAFQSSSSSLKMARRLRSGG